MTRLARPARALGGLPPPRPGRHLRLRQPRSPKYFLTASNISIALAGAMPVAIVALADDADHHHRRDRHLGRLDRRAVRRVAWRSCIEQGCRSKRRCWPAWSSARSPALSTALHRRLRRPAVAGRDASARSRSIAASRRSSSRSAASAAFPNGTRPSASARSAARRSRGARPSSCCCSSAFAVYPARHALGPGALRDRQQPRGRPLLRHRRRARHARRLRRPRAPCRDRRDRAHRLSRERPLRHRDRARAAGDHRGRARRRQHLRRQRHARSACSSRCWCSPSCRTRSASPA